MNGYNNSDGIDNGQNPPEKMKQADTAETSFSDGLFTISISQDMTIRNQLRSGLVEALGKNQTQIPLFVSWPNWLDDGIVCLYAKDLHRIIHDTVRKTVNELGDTFGIEALSGEGIFDIIPTPDAAADVAESSDTLSDSTSDVLSELSAGEPIAQSEAAADSPYSEEPTHSVKSSDTPTSTPKRVKQVTDQDIADQLFEELKKGKKS